jgi:hypothetical protein
MRHDEYECMRCELFELRLIELLLGFEEFTPRLIQVLVSDVKLIPRHVCCGQLHVSLPLHLTWLHVHFTMHV